VARTYPIDIEPEQIVRWLVAEENATPSLFRFDARCANEVRDIPDRSEYHLGDVEREDLEEVDTVATLEVRPARASEGWTLTVTVEDEAGPGVTGQEAGNNSEQQMDLGAFYRHFIRSGRGIATATANVQTAAGEQHLKEILDAILVDRHPATAAARHHV
jgi:hypothetical protein